MCSLKVSSYKSSFLDPTANLCREQRLLSHSVSDLRTEPAAPMDVEEQETETPQEQYIAIRTALGDESEDIDETLKIFERINTADALISTSSLEKEYGLFVTSLIVPRFEEIGDVYCRLLELEGCGLIMNIQGKEEILWGLQEHLKKWTVPGFTVQSI